MARQHHPSKDAETRAYIARQIRDNPGIPVDYVQTGINGESNADLLEALIAEGKVERYYSGGWRVRPVGNGRRRSRS